MANSTDNWFRQTVTRLYVLLLTTLVFLVSHSGYAQSNKLGPYSNTNRFEFNKQSTKVLAGVRHAPKNSTATAYNKKGEAFKLATTDTITITEVYTGTWNNKSGTWALFYDSELNARDLSADYYVFLTDMIDVKDPVIDPAVQKEKRRIALTTSRTVFITRVAPVVIFLLVSIFLFRKFYLKVSAVFAAITGHPVSGFLGLLYLTPLFIFIYKGFDSGGSYQFDAFVNWLFLTLGIEKQVLQMDISTLPYWQILYYMLVVILLLVASVFIIWIGIGLILSGVVALASGGGHSAVSYDGGRTFHFNFSSGSDIDLNGVVQLWLVYSIVFPITCILAGRLWPVEGNLLRPLFLGFVLTVALTLLYKFFTKRNQKLDQLITNSALSFLGFAVCIVTLFLILLTVGLLKFALAPNTI